MTQSIILYRNPMEQAFWEGGYAFPVFVGMVVAVITAIVFVTIYEKLCRQKFTPWNKPNHSDIVALVGALVGFAVTITYMH